MTLPPPSLPPGGRLLNFPKKSGYQCPICLDQPEVAPNQPAGTPISFGMIVMGDDGNPKMVFLCLLCYGNFLRKNVPELVPFTGLVPSPNQMVEGNNGGPDGTPLS